MANWCGLKKVKAIWNGSWSDPQIEYKEELINEWDAQEFIGESFEFEMKEKGIDIPENKWHDMFAEWVKDNEEYIYSLLDDMLWAMHEND